MLLLAPTAAAHAPLLVTGLWNAPGLIRAQLQAAYSIPHDWWRAQPRCTTKSAWITISAARTLAQRVDRLIACANLGIAITLVQDPCA